VVFPILIIAVAAAEAAVALAVVISLFRHRKNLDARAADSLSG
jgi:NADH:ubiquinone oxidoreductase subunit K